MPGSINKKSTLPTTRQNTRKEIVIMNRYLNNQCIQPPFNDYGRPCYPTFPTCATGPQGPQGPQGLQGPQGPVGPDQAYGAISTNGGSTHSLTATAQTLCFDTLLVSNGVTPNLSPCRLTINVTGVYEIVYKWLITSSVSTAVTVSIRRFGTSVANETYTLAANSQRNIYNSFFLSLTAGDILDIVASSSPNATITSPVGLASVFSAKRIGTAPVTSGLTGIVGLQELSCLNQAPNP